MLTQTFGVEIEMYAISRAKAAAVVAAVLNANTSHNWSVYGPGHHLHEMTITYRGCPRSGQWKVESDSSIIDPHGGAELVTPVLHWEDMELLQTVVRALREAGARSNPTHQCGVHVHVGGDGHTAQSLTNLANLMAAHEQLLISALAVSAQRISWCKPVDPAFIEMLNKKKPKTISALADVWYSSQNSHGGLNQIHYNHTRYHMLNLHSYFEHQNIEFRLFQFYDCDPSAPANRRRGGLHAGLLKSYVQLCLAMSHYAKQARCCSAKPLQNGNLKYSMRCWLLRLGFIGDDFSTARELLTWRLPGDSAFRDGRPGQIA